LILIKKKVKFYHGANLHRKKMHKNLLDFCDGKYQRFEEAIDEALELTEPKSPSMGFTDIRN
jgi:hypothetical protein